MKHDQGEESLQRLIRAQLAVVTSPYRREPAHVGSTSVRAVRTATVVVGVDGSRAAERAVVWAATEAVVRGARLTLVRIEEPLRDPAHTQEKAQGDLNRMSALAQEVRKAHADLDVVPLVDHGVAGPALVEYSRNADLLVLGSRGRGAVTRILLGSVSAYCAAHAHCPTVVVPPDWPARLSQ